MWFTLVSLPMNFLDRTFLDWKVMLEPIAARKPPQLKVASVTDAIATPPTMGNRDSTIGMVGVSPRNAADRATLKNGSSAYKSGLSLAGHVLKQDRDTSALQKGIMLVYHSAWRRLTKNALPMPSVV